MCSAADETESDDQASRGRGSILDGVIFGTYAGDMIGKIALFIEMGAEALDIGKTIHPHPTLGESIGMAAARICRLCGSRPGIQATRQSPSFHRFWLFVIWVPDALKVSTGRNCANVLFYCAC